MSSELCAFLVAHACGDVPDTLWSPSCVCMIQSVSQSPRPRTRTLSSRPSLEKVTEMSPICEVRAPANSCSH